MNTAIIITAIGCFTGLIIIITPIYIGFKLKQEKIKADAMVRAEEIKAKNQLEIEKLLHLNNLRTEEASYFDEEISRNSRANKERL